MAAFGTDAAEWQRLDLRLMQNGPVVLYFRPAILNEDMAQLRSEGYNVDEFDCSTWQNEADFHTDVAARLAFPGYYGHNLDAFNDCIGDIEVPNTGGRALVLRGLDKFSRREPRVAQIILDILASASWYHLLFGRRLLTLVQSDNPQILFEPIGASSVLWNPREWMNKDRGL